MTCCAPPSMLEAARAFSDRILRPRAGEFDRDQAVPLDILQSMGEEGFLGSILPVEYGGAGMSPLDYGLLTLELGKGCGSTRALLTVHTSLVGETLARLGNADQKAQWLPDMAKGKKLACFALSEPETGSDAMSIKTTYRQENGSFVINGHKKWISYGAVADIFLVFASNNGAISAFIVERGAKGLTTQPLHGMLGNRGAHIAQVMFNEVEVPESHLIGRLGAGFSFVANTALFYGRYSIAWAGLALAEAALEEMVTYARKREQFGKKLRQYQLVQAMIADSVVDVHTCRAMCERIASLRARGADEAIMETNIAKCHTSRAAMSVAMNAVQVFGGNGCWDQYPVERLFREAKILEIIEGTTQIQQMMIAEFGVRRYYRT